MPRLSADVDVTLRLSPEDPERFAADMHAAGFALRVDDPDFVRRTRVMPFVHLSTAMPVDVVLAASGLEDEFLDRARVVDLGGTSVPLIDPEDLIIAKVLAGRPKDVEDARGLWQIHGQRLDADRIHRTLRLLEEALSLSDRLQLRVGAARRGWQELTTDSSTRGPFEPLRSTGEGQALEPGGAAGTLVSRESM